MRGWLAKMERCAGNDHPLSCFLAIIYVISKLLCALKLLTFLIGFNKQQGSHHGEPKD